MMTSHMTQPNDDHDDDDHDHDSIMNGQEESVTTVMYESYPSFDIEPTTGFPLPIFTCAWCANGMILLGGGGGNAKTGVFSGLIVCRVQDGKLVPIGQIDTGDSIVNAVALNPKFMEIACAVDCEQVILRLGSREKWLVKAQYKTCYDQGKYASQHITRYSRDGRLVVAGGSDGIIRIYARPNELKKVIERKGEVSDIDFNNDATVIATTADNDTCDMYSVQSGTLIRSLQHTHNGKPAKFCCARFVMFRGFSEVLVTAVKQFDGRESYLIAWHPETWEVAHKLFVGAGPLIDVCVGHARDIIACLSVDRNTEHNCINIFKVDTWSNVRTIDVADKMATCIALSPNDTHIMFGAPNYAEILPLRSSQRGCCESASLVMIQMILVVLVLYTIETYM